MNIFTTILAEFLLITSSILFLFTFRKRLGLAPLYILLGSVQYLQALSGTRISFKIFGEFTLYPGSVILFSAVLFAVLLIYIKEGVASARTLIIGIIIANFILSALFGISYVQELTTQNSNEIASSSVFLINYKYFIAGTIILLVDFILLVTLYQFLITKIGKQYFFWVLFIALFSALIFDAFAFNVVLKYNALDFKTSLIGHTVGKSIAALAFSIILYGYLKFIDKERNKATFIANQSRDIFSILTDQKNNINQIEKKLSSQLEATLNHISDGFVSLDTNWCFTYVNIKAGEILGRIPESLIGKHIWTEFPEGVGLSLYHLYNKALETQETIFFEEYFEPFDTWYENRIYPSPDGLTIYFTDITESKLAKKEIEEMQQKIEAAIRIGKIGYWSWDVIKDEIYWSDLMYKIYDVEKHTTLKYDSVVDCIHPDDKDYHDKLIAQRIKDKSNESFEYRVLWKDKTVRHLMVQMEVIDDEFGNAIKFQGTVIDITELKEAQEQIIKSEKYLENILNNIGDPVFVKDDQSRLQIVNDAFCEIFNLKRTDILGKTLAEDVQPDEKEDFLRIDNQVLETGVENVNIETLTLGGNEPLIISTKKTRFIDSNGNKFIIGTIRNITEQKKAEEEILALGKRNTLIIETLLDGFILADTTGQILDANPSYVNMIGYPLKELLTMNINQLEVALTQSEIEERIKEMVGKGFARFNSNHQKKNGEIIDLDVNTFVMQANNQQVVAAFVKDTTESKKTAIELEKHRNHLEELIKIRTEEVDAKNAELQRMNKLFVGRELRMKELKNIIKEMKLKNEN